MVQPVLPGLMEQTAQQALPARLEPPVLLDLQAQPALPVKGLPDLRDRQE
jgi:hypothetical protein